MMRRRSIRGRGLVVLLGAVLVLSAVAGPAAAESGAPPAEIHEGTLADGTSWRADVPVDWNGTVFTDLDHYRPDTAALPAWKAHLVEAGYAYIGTERDTVGYNYRQAIDNQVQTLREFEAIVGGPAGRVVALGSSRGGFVARGVIEAYPGIYDGAVPMCGGGAGVVATFNQKLDAVFALKTLLAEGSGIDVSGMELVDITDGWAQNALLSSVVEQARATSAGRARLALAAAFGQTQPWSQPGTERPGRRDWEAQIDNIADAFAFGHPAHVRQGIEEAAGGNVSWNHGVDYKRLLVRSGALRRVMALYRGSGLNLWDDLAILDTAPRISADPDAVAFAEANVTYSGEVGGPVLTLHTIGDPADPIPFENAYTRTLREAGNNKLLRSVQVDRPGHCAFNGAERVAAVLTLLDRIESGRWGFATRPRAMNARAAQLEQEHPQLGSGEFVEVRHQRPLRTWDASDRGGYQPE